LAKGLVEVYPCFQYRGWIGFLQGLCKIKLEMEEGNGYGFKLMQRSVSILGSTGSIGKNTLEVVRHLKGDISVAGLAASSNIELLEQQVKEFRPKAVAVHDEEKAAELRKRLPETEVFGGIEGVEEIARLPEADTIVSAISGAVGLRPTLEGIKQGKRIALANKEVLVAAGKLVTDLAKEKGAEILPVDSEHSAIFQCLSGGSKEEIGRIVLTASGGPFHRWSLDRLDEVTVDDALAHPTWSMGAKNTVDSSTLMNKGLEVIEAYWLFDVPLEKLEVAVHPQSVVHSMVEYRDGSIIAQLSKPDMQLPIQYALTYPHRLPGTLEPFDFLKHPMLEFYLPDRKKFICLDLAFQAIASGKSCPCFLNAVNEVLVERFLDGGISWIEIGRKAERLLELHQAEEIRSLDDVFAVDEAGRKKAREI